MLRRRSESSFCSIFALLPMLSVTTKYLAVEWIPQQLQACHGFVQIGNVSTDGVGESRGIVSSISCWKGLNFADQRIGSRVGAD
ncbi:Uncharacterized protein TCM_006213 [Theobroma cacao]|uniref:Secreted protein n=1 Tax=Theobroma cacao TaxID=3641 RepID=A0A061DXI0_THECC|nr:Uncharacterized protein TCM_006213 [Theobroma cacao]